MVIGCNQTFYFWMNEVIKFLKLERKDVEHKIFNFQVNICANLNKILEKIFGKEITLKCYRLNHIDFTQI